MRRVPLLECQVWKDLMFVVEKDGSDDVQDAGHLPKGFAP